MAYWTKLHNQIQKYGKRPDVLIFLKANSLNYPVDIRERDEEEIMEMVKHSVAGQ